MNIVPNNNEINIFLSNVLPCSMHCLHLKKVPANNLLFTNWVINDFAMLATLDIFGNQKKYEIISGFNFNPYKQRF